MFLFINIEDALLYPVFQHTDFLLKDAQIVPFYANIPTYILF